MKNIQDNKQQNFDNLLDIIDLWIEYRTLEGIFYAVNGIDLNLKKGESLGLVGETGAGKTTTSKAILQILPKQAVITKGKVIFNNKNLFQLKPKEMESIRGSQISMVFQDPLCSLDPVYTVAYQIAETVRVHERISWRKANQRAIEILRQVEISLDRANDYPHEFSGGMIQRVMIAIALVCKPYLLIADEPTTALDVTIQAQVLELMKELKNSYKTSLILITHDLGIVPEVCDSVAVMYAGRIVEKGDIKSVYGNPLHPYTKGLFACIPEVNKPTKDLKPIKGLSPSSKTIVQGCAFYPRCEGRLALCRTKTPELISIKDKQSVACFEYCN